MQRYSRRRFLVSTAGAVGAVALSPRLARADVNSQIRIAVIGVNGRGRNHIREFSNQLVALCDCDRRVLGQRAEEFERKHGRKVEQIVDYRELLDRGDVDAVSIATPNHTHALIATAAAEAGKHVYCEKPVSQCVWEGRQLVNAARRYDRIIQCGTQARSARCIQQAVEYVQSGKLGRVQYAVGTCFKPRRSIGKLDRPLAVPSHVDYELWCGPAAKVDLFRPRLHYDWHWDFNTGCGDIGNQGLHQMDVARWFLGERQLAPRVISIGGRFGYEDAADTPNTQIVLLDYPAAPLVFEVRGLPKSKAAQTQDWEGSMDRYRESQIGVIVQCEQGHVYASNSYNEVLAFDPDGKQIKHWQGGGDHFANFLAAVESGRRDDLNAEILAGHVSSALCHVANISHKLGQPRTAEEIMTALSRHPRFVGSVDRMIDHLRANGIDVDRPVITAGAELEIDPEAEQFIGSDEANRLLHRDDRPPFVVPRVA